MQRECFPPSAVESPAALQSLWHHAPETCLIAVDPEPAGYILAHPWADRALPPLQAELPGLPDPAPCLFVHDLAVLPARRGRGLAGLLVGALLDRARALGLHRGSLLAVQQSEPFWARYGFTTDRALTERFVDRVRSLYGLEFSFMTADWTAGPFRR
jgi:GNAT superfamily N-acetyltransferase